MLESKQMPNQSETNKNTVHDSSDNRMVELRLWVPHFLAVWYAKKAKENFFSHRNLYVRHVLLGIYRRENGK